MKEERGFAHLCGDATRHFDIIRDELDVYTFDTGFPVRHRELCLQLGKEVTIMGGPSVGLINVTDWSNWLKTGAKNVYDKAHEYVENATKGYRDMTPVLDSGLCAALDEIVKEAYAEMKSVGKA